MIQLSKKYVQLIQKILANYAQVELAKVFGSRVLKTHQKGSDLDLALYGEISSEIFSHIKSDLEDSNLPYFIDVVIYNQVQNQELKQHVDRHGVVCYKRSYIDP